MGFVLFPGEKKNIHAMFLSVIDYGNHNYSLHACYSSALKMLDSLYHAASQFVPGLASV